MHEKASIKSMLMEGNVSDFKHYTLIVPGCNGNALCEIQLRNSIDRNTDKWTIYT